VHAICINSAIYLSSFQLSEYCFAESLPAFLLHQHLCHVVAVNIPLDQVGPAKPGKNLIIIHTLRNRFIRDIFPYQGAKKKQFYFQAVTIM